MTYKGTRWGYLTELLGSHAVEVITGYAKSAQPFLLSLHFNAPHWPWEGPGDWNTGMLPEVNERSTGGITGDPLADHVGARRATTTADNPVAPAQ
jgi:hypothetical protein